MKAGLWTLGVIVALVVAVMVTRANDSVAGPATMPKEKLYVWNNDGQYGRVEVFTDPQTLCRYLVGYRMGITPRLTRSGKIDCPGAY